METAAAAAHFDPNAIPEGAVPVGPDHLDTAFVQPIAPVARRRRDGTLIYGDPHGTGVDDTFVTFYKNPVANADWIKKSWPGNKLFKVDRPVTEQDRIEYADKWLLYQNHEDQLKGQTRLTNIAWIDDASRNRLADVRILTVEQLAKVTDTNLQHLGPGMRKFVMRAKQHLGEKAQYKKAHEVKQEVEVLREENAKLAEQNKEMLAKMNELIEATKAGKSAPAKRGAAKAAKETENAD